MLCRLCLFKDNEQAHIHSMLHHRELDSVLGTRSFHNCQACMVSSMGLQEFAQHISTAEHKYKLEKLICKKQKPIPLEDHLSQEDLDKVRRRTRGFKENATNTSETSISAAPIRVVDVSSMLRQIRRELGVREPCRADREAKKQKSEVRARRLVIAPRKGWKRNANCQVPRLRLCELLWSTTAVHLQPTLKDDDSLTKRRVGKRRKQKEKRPTRDLDKSLVQARNALQAAYTEVQRLLLLKQQVDGLRAQSIEILQGMQEVYSGSSDVAATTTISTSSSSSSTGHSHLPSSHACTPTSSQQTPASTTASSITQPQTPLLLPATSIKQETCHPPTAGQAIPPEPPQRPVSTEPSSRANRRFSRTTLTEKFNLSRVPVMRECVDERAIPRSFLNHNGPIYSLQSMRACCTPAQETHGTSLQPDVIYFLSISRAGSVKQCSWVTQTKSTVCGVDTSKHAGTSLHWINDETIRCHSLKSKKCLELILYQTESVWVHHRRRPPVLLIGSSDSTISIRDAKSGLLLRSLQGHSKTVLCIKVSGERPGLQQLQRPGVHAHNIHTGVDSYLQGSQSAVTSIFILGQVMLTPVGPMIRVYDLQIYSGCYDGSIRAVKLNLTKNHHCWWQNALLFSASRSIWCSTFLDHTPNLESVRCRWRGCDAFFATQQRSAGLPEHMQNHVQNDSKVEP
ncbi:hypothetical protein INR49_018492 [Caranx melampygus]|nr:hypothetical protein INR49_018492 [Caranx melampygus]